MTITSKPLALAVSTLLLMAASASAQNTAFGLRDLFLTFQNPNGAVGATAVLSAVAGTTGTTAGLSTFRDAPDGTFTNLTNIGAALSAAFGPNWASEPTLFAAGIGNTGTSSTVATITSLDAQRTIYFTRQRLGVGTVGQQNSAGFTNANSSFYTAAAGGINGLKTQFETGPGAGSFPTFQSTTTTSNIDNSLSFSGANQDPAFSVITGGVQGNFGPGSFGTFGSAGNVEIALDLFRMQPGSTDSGANPNVTGLTGVADFLGTLTINSTGQVAFTGNITATPVPEPATGLMGAVTALFAATLRRRKVVA